MARRLGIRDPRAALSVASAEGLSGGIGDSGTSFGPWQLHAGGALPKGLRNPHQWAWSNPGLLYALSQIKRVAGNRSGADAIANIVNRFERPANAQGEIAKALAYYRGGGGGAAPFGVPDGQNTSPVGNNNRQLINAIINNQSLIPAITAMQATPNQAQILPQSVSPTGGVVPAELFYRDQALKFGKHIGAVKGHYDHVHVAYTNPQAMLHAIALAQKLGLHVGENPYIGGVDPVHATHSYHYRNFKEKYHGKRLGEALDVSGSPKLMGQYYQLLAGGR